VIATFSDLAAHAVHGIAVVPRGPRCRPVVTDFRMDCTTCGITLIDIGGAAAGNPCTETTNGRDNTP
jgi:hypothetical protein